MSKKEWIVVLLTVIFALVIAIIGACVIASLVSEEYMRFLLCVILGVIEAVLVIKFETSLVDKLC